jgi:hypothetical protein
VDPFSAETWKQQVAVIMDAPYVIIPLIALTAAAVWWLRGKMADERLAALSERLKLAQEQANYAQDRLEERVSALKSGVEQGATHRSIVDALNRISEAIEAQRAAGRKIVAIVNERISTRTSFNAKSSLRTKATLRDE